MDLGLIFTVLALVSPHAPTLALADTTLSYYGSNGMPFNTCLGEMKGHTEWPNQLPLCFRDSGNYSENAVNVVKKEDWFPNDHRVKEVRFVCNMFANKIPKEAFLITTSSDHLHIEMPCSFNAKAVRKAMEQMQERLRAGEISNSLSFGRDSGKAKAVFSTKSIKLTVNLSKTLSMRDDAEIQKYAEWFTAQITSCMSASYDADGCRNELQKTLDFLSLQGLEIYRSDQVYFNDERCEDLGKAPEKLSGGCLLGEITAILMEGYLQKQNTQQPYVFNKANERDLSDYDQIYIASAYIKNGTYFAYSILGICEMNLACTQRLKALEQVLVVHAAQTQKDLCYNIASINYDAAGNPIPQLQQSSCSNF